jgi:hypothetical protein
MKTVHKNSQNNRHQYAFNQFGQPIHIFDAVKNQIEKYYYDQNQMIEMILKDGEKNVKHFSLKSKSEFEFEYQGKKFRYDSQNESPEHYNFKVKIFNERYFNWKNYLIHIDFPKTEIVAEGSNYRFDLKAKLLDGTDIGIEIVKTSSLSNEKRAYLQSKQILTFIIFLDKDGNQRLEEFDIIGNSDLEQLQERILKGKRECEKIQRTERSVYFDSRREGKQIERDTDGKILEYKNDIESKIRALEYEVINAEGEYYRSSKDSGYVNESKVTSISKEIKQIIELLRKSKRSIQMVRNEIRDSEISEKAILANKELLRKKRLEKQ